MFHIHSIASRHHCRKQYNMHILFADFPIGKQNETMSSLNIIMHWCARSPFSEIHPYFQAQLASNVYSRVRGNRAELNAHTNSCTVRLNSVETTNKKKEREQNQSLVCISSTRVYVTVLCAMCVYERMDYQNRRTKKIARDINFKHFWQTHNTCARSNNKQPIALSLV